MEKIFKSIIACMLLLSVGFFAACSDDDDDPKPEEVEAGVEIVKKNNTALLLCSFGSTYEQPQATYDQIIKEYQAAYPNTDIYMSFTSGTIVSRVYAQIGKAYAQPDVWFKELGKAGYETVYVQSLHIIPGEEYLGLMNNEVKKKLMIPYPDVVVAKGACLLETEEDVDAVAKILYDYYKARLDKGEVVALMGHGNPDTEYTHAKERYSQLEAAMQELSGDKNIFVGTVDWGEKMFTHVRKGIVAFAESKGKENKEITVSLSPLMSVAGDHAQNDLLGDLEDGQKAEDVDPYEDDWEAESSWKLKLENMGFNISEDGSNTDPAKFNVIGLADHSKIRSIWLNHMKEAVQNAESWNEHLGE